jgi:hypothetical protein
MLGNSEHVTDQVDSVAQLIELCFTTPESSEYRLGQEPAAYSLHPAGHQVDSLV